MKYILLLIFLPTIALASKESGNLVELDSAASDFRMLAIKCATDLKLTKKDKLDLPSCNNLTQFISNDLDGINNRLKTAQNEAKSRGTRLGLEDPQLRNDLILIMSARSHLNIATMVTKATKK